MNFNHSTQEAIKVGLAASLSVLCALWFGWEKSYWAAITVVLVAATESYSHAIKRGQNRLIGTIVGVVFAVFLLAMYPQDHLLFFTMYCVFLALCVFMSAHNRWGYASTIAFTVCAVVVCSGGFDGVSTFDVAILRTQQNVLGVVVYTIVFRLVWPKKTEDMFFSLIPQVIAAQKQRITQLQQNEPVQRDEASIAQQQQRLNKLNEILTLPLNASHRLRSQRRLWRSIMSAIVRTEQLLDKSEKSDNINSSRELDYAIAGEKLIAESMLSIKSSHLSLSLWMLETKNNTLIEPQAAQAFLLPIKSRFKNVAKALSILITCLVMWIYIPLPGGYIVPMIASILANVLVTLPDNAVRHAGLGCIAWGIFFLTQYVLIMPAFTEVWQLCALLFVNIMFIWKVCSAPSLGIQKVLGGNLAVILPMGAFQLTPEYSMEKPLLMLMLVFICVGVAGFYNKLFSNSH